MKLAMRAAGLAVFLSSILTIPAGAEDLILPAGTKLHLVMETGLNTKDTKAGSPFRARLVMPVFANEREVVPVGSTVEGTVVSVKAPGRVAGEAQMQLRPEKLSLPDGRTLTLSASLKETQGGEDLKMDSEEGTITRSGKEGMDTRGVITSAGTSAVIGGVMAGGAGAAIGAGAVGTIALLHQIFKRGKDADLPPGSEIVLELSRPAYVNTMEEVPPEKRKPSDPGREPFVVR